MNIREHIRAEQKGMTLVEVLVALAILSLLATSVLAIFSPTGLWISKARNETTATNYATALLEDLRDKNLPLQPVTGAAPEDLGLDQQYKPGQPAGITARIDIEPMAGFVHLYKVDVSIAWSEGTELCEIKLSTLIRRV